MVIGPDVRRLVTYVPVGGGVLLVATVGAAPGPPPVGVPPCAIPWGMPTSPGVRRLVTYLPAAHAEEIARRAALDGRTVSGWLAHLVADTLGAGRLDDPEYAAWLRRHPGQG